MVDEKVKIKCTKCSQVFRERAQKVRDGFQTKCQHCNRLITFDTTSDDRNIRRALTSAAQQPEAATALIRFLASPEAAPVISKAGLMPVSKQ